MPFLTYTKVFYTDLEALEPYSDEEVGRFFRAMLHYMATGEDPRPEGNERFAWGLRKKEMDAQRQSYLNKIESIENARKQKSDRNQSEINMKSDRNQSEINMNSIEDKKRKEMIRNETIRKDNERGRVRKSSFEEHDLPSKELVDSFFLDLDKLTDSIKAKEI